MEKLDGVPGLVASEDTQPAIQPDLQQVGPSNLHLTSVRLAQDAAAAEAGMLWNGLVRTGEQPEPEAPTATIAPSSSSGSDAPAA